MVKVVVLLSTYNGGRYLEEQLASLIDQKGVQIEVLVRDDGSTDSTINILNKWKEGGTIEWYKGDNLRPARSFFDLIEKAPDADFYAFCDQDDVWLPDKLKIAVSMLSKINCEKPSLYFGAYQMTDDKLNCIETTLRNPILDLYHALVDNSATGCTVVFDYKLLNAARKYSPSYITMHDDWLYLLCFALGGNVVYDNKPHILYRQHGDNVVGGIKQSWLEKYKNRIKKVFLSGNCFRTRLASEIIRGYSDIIPSENLKIIRDFVGYRKGLRRVYVALNFNYYRGNNIGDNIRLLVMFLTGKI